MSIKIFFSSFEGEIHHKIQDDIICLENVFIWNNVNYLISNASNLKIMLP